MDEHSYGLLADYIGNSYARFIDFLADQTGCDTPEAENTAEQIASELEKLAGRI
jgi:hypothetical protein